MKKIIIVLAVLFFVIISTAAFATILYVNPNGTCGGNSPCYTTPQGAASVVNPGDIVIVADGTYTDTNSDEAVISLNRGGTSTNWITFRSENKWGAVLDATNAQYCWMLGASADYIRIEGFEMKDAENIGIYSNDGSSNIYIYNNHIHDIGRSASNSGMGRPAVYCRPGNTYFTMDSNVVHTIGRLNPYTTPSASASTCANCTDGATDCCYNHDHGLYSGGCTNVTVINNVFYDMKSGWPVLIGSLGSNNVNIMNNTMYGDIPSKGGHISLVGSVSNVNIWNNISHSPRGHLVQSSTGTDDTSISIKNNIVYNVQETSFCKGTECPDVGSSSATTYTSYTISGDIYTNPLFANIDTNDFTLQEGSSAIDTGTHTAWATSTSYSVNNIRSNSGTMYRCLIAHTSGTFSTDLAAGKWIVMADADNVSRAAPSEIGAYEYGTSADTTAPTVPSNVSAVDGGETTMVVTFTGSTDAVGVTGYNAYRCTGAACTPTVKIYSGLAGSPFNDSGLTASTTYCYSFSAEDAATNESVKSTAGCDATDAAPVADEGTVIYGTSTTRTDCSDFAGSDAISVGDYQTLKRMYNFASLYICIDSTDATITATGGRDSCAADDAAKIVISPTNNFGDGTDLTIILSMNGKKQDSTVTLGLAKDVPADTRVTQVSGHTYLWMRIPLSEIYIIPQSGTVWGFQPCEINGSTQGATEKCSTAGTMTFGTPNISYIRLTE